MVKTIYAEGAPAAIGPYCHAKLAGDTLFCSGQLGLDPATGALPEGVEAQAKQAMENVGAVLRAAGFGYGDVVKTTIFLKDMGDFGKVNEVYGAYFPAEPPARSCVAAACLPKDGLVEIEVIASK